MVRMASAIQRSDARLGPTRPDKLSIWPVSDGEFGLDVTYSGAQGYRRAEIVERQLKDAGVKNRLQQEVDGTWTVRFGPVGREHMLTVLNGFVW
jgi:hypothetical protein